MYLGGGIDAIVVFPAALRGLGRSMPRGNAAQMVRPRELSRLTKPSYHQYQQQHRRGLPRYLYVAGAIPLGFAAIYVYNLEKAPYTGRWRSIIVSKGKESAACQPHTSSSIFLPQPSSLPTFITQPLQDQEVEMGQAGLQSILAQYKGKILPPSAKVGARMPPRLALVLIPNSFAAQVVHHNVHLNWSCNRLKNHINKFIYLARSVLSFAKSGPVWRRKRRAWTLNRCSTL
jgi:hypothetical protein